MRKTLVYRRNPGARVVQKDRDIRFVDRDLRLAPHPRFQRLVCHILESGRVDQAKVDVPDASHCFLAIARNAGLIVDDCDLPARKPVEQRRFTDIRTTDDGHRQRHGETPEVAPSLLLGPT